MKCPKKSLLPLNYRGLTLHLPDWPRSVLLHPRRPTANSELSHSPNCLYTNASQAEKFRILLAKNSRPYLSLPFKLKSRVPRREGFSSPLLDVASVAAAFLPWPYQCCHLETPHCVTLDMRDSTSGGHPGSRNLCPLCAC